MPISKQTKEKARSLVYAWVWMTLETGAAVVSRGKEELKDWYYEREG